MACPLFSISKFYLLSQLILLAVPAFSSGVTVSTPLDDQLPLIARVGQPYSWSISKNTFRGCDDILSYSVSDLPAWLAFDPQSLNFHGTPSQTDQGDLDVSVTVYGCSATTSSWFSLPVTSNPPPTLKTSIAEQFNDDNPSLASVFVIGPSSVLRTSHPALRIPPKWSFSIGLRGDTYGGTDSVFYQVSQADGSEIPNWMHFDPHQFTLGGVTPSEESMLLPAYFNLVLHASDIRGATAETQAFDIIIAGHDLSLANAALPTVNISADSTFDVPLNSAADFSGLMVDGNPLLPKDLIELLVDTSGYPWISYDLSNRHLTGDAPSKIEETPVLPVEVRTTFNQTINTNLSVALFPSFFVADSFPTVVLGEDRHVEVAFKQFFSNASSSGPDDVDLSTNYEPSEAADVLRFDPQTAVLGGDLPSTFSPKHINVTITAYSHFTHSTSHATVTITMPPSDLNNEDIGTGHNGRRSGLSKKIVLGLSITFGVVGSVIALGVCLASFRHCARVEDSALVGEAGQRAWSEKDKKWYGVGSPKSYDEAEKSIHSPSPVLKANPYGGLGLRRVLERSHSDMRSNLSSAGSNIQSPGVMSKRDFMLKIRDTVRNVSDKYSWKRQPLNLDRPVIGRPILIINDEPSSTSVSSNPFADQLPTDISVIRTSLSDDGSISRRRDDLLSPRPPATVHFEEGTSSRDSMISVANHAAEAVVQTASRASVRSAMSFASDIHVPTTRPRLVPFTSATRVPIPNMSVSSPTDSSESHGLDPSQRVVSQTALVDDTNKNGGGGDDLSIGIHYVRALGGSNQQPVGTTTSTLTVSTNVRSSFSSLESSHDGHGHSGLEAVNMVVRAGERFKFRVPVEPPSPASDSSMPRLQARLMSGNPLPRFLHTDLIGRRDAGAVEFYGVPGGGDVSELDVGVFDAGVCVGRVYLEVIGR